MDTAIELHDVSVNYGSKPVLWGVDINFPSGNIIGIVGPNGAGKSTLLKAMMGLVPLGSGYIKILNQPLEAVRKQLSYVPQKETVDWNFPACVEEVVMMGRYGHLGLFRRPGNKDKIIVEQSLERVGMLGLAKRQIGQLSGGQQQRLFLARALAQEADIYLMDEPFAAVDIATEQTILGLLQEMVEQGKTVVVVHHNLQSVKNFFDWVLLLNVRVVAAGVPAEVLTPELLEEAYGSQLTLLTEVAHTIKEENIIPRKEERAL